MLAPRWRTTLETVIGCHLEEQHNALRQQHRREAPELERVWILVAEAHHLVLATGGLLVPSTGFHLRIMREVMMRFG